MDFLQNLQKEYGTFDTCMVYELKRELPNRERGTKVFFYNGNYKNPFWKKYIHEGSELPDVGWYYFIESDVFKHPCPYYADTLPEWFNPVFQYYKIKTSKGFINIPFNAIGNDHNDIIDYDDYEMDGWYDTLSSIFKFDLIYHSECGSWLKIDLSSDTYWGTPEYEIIQKTHSHIDPDSLRKVMLKELKKYVFQFLEDNMDAKYHQLKIVKKLKAFASEHKHPYNLKQCKELADDYLAKFIEEYKGI